jgi:hypothetical protein
MPPAEMHETARSRSREQKEASAQAMAHAFADLETALDQANALLIGLRGEPSS